MAHKILCTDGFAQAGIDELKGFPSVEAVNEKSLSHEELLAKIPSFDGLIVRSASKVGRDVIESGARLKIVARAGVGVDNIDLGAATEKGIFVVNTPAGNTTSTAELAFAMLLALSRHVPQAARLMLEGVWEKKKFMGTEVAGKTLGIVGLGRIGREVAKRAMAFGMKVIACDPLLPEERFESFGVARVAIDELCKNSDYITIHAQLTSDTENLIGKREFCQMKKTARIINCARGGIVNEDDLAEALRAGTIAGAALDVFTEEPFTRPVFKGLDNIILTPHLGASTREAQDAVAIEAARAVGQFFSEGMSAGAVNLQAGAGIEGLKAHIRLAGKLGALLAQCCRGSIRRIAICGTEATPGILALAAVQGALSRAGGERVTLVNAGAVAKRMGIAVAEEIVRGGQDFAGAFGVALDSDSEKREAWGAVLSDGTARIVMLDGYRVEIAPSGPILLIHNSDQPGVIGRVSSILGDAGVNIAEMQNVRKKKGAEALTIIRIDGAMPEKTLKEIGAVSGVTSAALVEL
ncbi:MAG: phosphoglycerate dehydrogenase [Pseudomonadota bacterium]